MLKSDFNSHWVEASNAVTSMNENEKIEALRLIRLFIAKVEARKYDEEGRALKRPHVSDVEIGKLVKSARKSNEKKN
jgi:hypothetical protein